VFTERSAQLPPRRRLTKRLRVRLEQAASVSARALSDVAAEYRVSWWSVQRALLVAAVGRAEVAPAPVRMLGLDETRARSLRWSWADGIGWRLSNPWMTSFVDLDVGRPGWLLGLVPGRSGAAVQTWIAAQDPACRDGVEVVALDPSAPFAAAIRRLLPQATVVVDHWQGRSGAAGLAGWPDSITGRLRALQMIRRLAQRVLPFPGADAAVTF